MEKSVKVHDICNSLQFDPQNQNQNYNFRCETKTNIFQTDLLVRGLVAMKDTGVP